MKRPSSSALLRAATLRSSHRRSDAEGDASIGMFVEMTHTNGELAKAGMGSLLDPEAAIDDEERVGLFDLLAEHGGGIREKYSWACPDARALRIISHFSPLVEVGSGHGYWASLLRKRGVDVMAFDLIGDEPTSGGKAVKQRPTGTPAGPSASARREAESMGVGVSTQGFWAGVQRGGPEVLAWPACHGRALLLCFPDEVGELALACLRSFTGDTIVHVGELIGDGTLSVGDAPWGRSTTRRFQEQLHSKFHCLLRVGLPTMATGRETLTVWRRSKCCPLMVPDDSDDEDGEEGAGLTMGAASDDSGGSSEDEEDEE